MLKRVALPVVAVLMAVLVILFLQSRTAPQDPELAPRSFVTSVALAQARAIPTKIDYTRLDARIRELMRQKDMVGLSIAVVEDGRLTFVQGYGVQGENGQPVTPHTVFRWASLSKGVASTLTAKLALAEKLDLSAPVARYRTSLRLNEGAEAQVTLADILSHRLGLPKNAYDGKLEGGEAPSALRGELADVPLLCPPGTCHSYQNIAYDTVSEIIARVTGDGYAEEVEKRLFRPLNMTSASVGMSGLSRTNDWARPHRGQRELTVLPSYYGIPAAAGVNSDIIDLARWMTAQMGESPDTLPQSLLDTVHRPRVKTHRVYGNSPFGRALADPAYGLGWRSFTYAGHRLTGHSGAVSGYRSTMMFDPEKRTGVVMLWNSNSARPFAFQGEVFDAYYGEAFHDWMALKEETVKQANHTSEARLSADPEVKSAR